MHNCGLSACSGSDNCLLKQVLRSAKAAVGEVGLLSGPSCGAGDGGVDLVVSLLMYNCGVLIFEYLLVGRFGTVSSVA